MRKFLAKLLLAGASLAVVAPAFAHHSFAAEFDIDKPIKLRGTVTKVEFMNPHSWIHINVKKDDGTVEEWAVEGGTPNTLFRMGVNKNSLPPARRSSSTAIRRATARCARTAATSRWPTAISCSSAARRRRSEPRRRRESMQEENASVAHIGCHRQSALALRQPLATRQLAQQAQAASKPNLSGIWQALEHRQLGARSARG